MRKYVLSMSGTSEDINLDSGVLFYILRNVLPRFMQIILKKTVYVSLKL